MKKLRILTAILAAALLFSSCGDLNSPVDSDTNGKARLCVGIGEKSARTILPTDIGESGITKAELLAKASEADSPSLVKEWTSEGTASAIAKMTADLRILIDTGNYDFTLNLYANFNGAQTLCQTGTLRAVTVSQGDNPLGFATNYVSGGSGNLSLTLTLSPESDYELGAVSVTDSSDNEVTATTDESDGTKYTFTMPASDVTISATFRLARTEVTGKIGKYEKPYFVGDIVFNDGSATPYTDFTDDNQITTAQKNAAIAVIFYAGSSTDVLGAKTLGVGLKNTQGETTETLVWAPILATGYTTNFTEIQCTPSESGSGKAATATFTGDLDGSDNWAKVCAADSTAQANAATNYLAFNWVNNYATTNSLTGDYASGWYLPTVAELSMMYRVKATVNAALEKAGGTQIADTGFYWSSSQSSSFDSYCLVCAVQRRPPRLRRQEERQAGLWSSNFQLAQTATHRKRPRFRGQAFSIAFTRKAGSTPQSGGFVAENSLDILRKCGIVKDKEVHHGNVAEPP